MKPRRDNPDEDWDQLAREREEQRQDDATARADREFRTYPEHWLDGDEW